MLKKLNVMLNILIGSVVGVFAGQAAFVRWDYTAHPDLYAMYSAPWYTGILAAGVVDAAILLVLLAAKAIVWQIQRKHTARGN